MKNTFSVRLIIFLILNFGALGIGGILQGEGPFSEWYQNLNIAPWTPPGWVFGAAWTSIMICYSIYLAYQFKQIKTGFIILFLIQFVLNISWNPVFFHYHLIDTALIIISCLTLVIAQYILGYKKQMGNKTLLLLPYFIWLCIATSLNAYALLNN